MTEAFVIHPNVVAIMCARRMVSYENYKTIIDNFFGTTKRILWHEKVYELAAATGTKCKVFPVKRECKYVSTDELMHLCEVIARYSIAPCVASGVYNWAMENLGYCILEVPTK